MTKDQQTVATVLAKELAEHVSECSIEQYRVLMVGRQSGRKALVVVAVSETATDRLQDFLDAEVESGRMTNEYLSPTFKAVAE